MITVIERRGEKITIEHEENIKIEDAHITPFGTRVTYWESVIPGTRSE